MIKAVACLVVGLLAGAIVERNFDSPRAPAGPAKMIDWRPADRYSFVVEQGEVFRLDRATGTVHIMRGDLSFDVPEDRDE